METKIVGTKVVHQISYTIHGMTGPSIPEDIPSRAVRLLESIPSGADRMMIQDVVVVGVDIVGSNGEKLDHVKLTSGPVNNELYYLAHSAQQAKALEGRGLHSIEAHPNHRGWTLIYGTAEQAGRQNPVPAAA